MKYTQFLIMLNSVGGLTWKRYLRRVEPLVNTVLMSYGLHILSILLAWPLTQDRHTVVSFKLNPVCTAWSKQQEQNLYVNANKTKFMCFKWEAVISTLSDSLKKFVHKFTYLASNISAIESEVNKHLMKAWAATDRLLFTWKCCLSDKIKWDFSKL